MTRKDYKILAQAFRVSYPLLKTVAGSKISTREIYATKLEQWLYDVNYVAELLELENNGFDVGKFKQACGVGVKL